jgi:mRNA interferase MazF
VLIVQSDDFNRSLIHTVIAVVITSNLRLADAPGNVRLEGRRTGLPKDSVANVSQIITLDRQFLKRKSGKLDSSTMDIVDDGVRLVLSL